MFKKGPDIDKKKLLLKASDVKKDSLTRLKHFKTLIEHLDFNELPLLFRTHFSFIYHTFIDTFSAFDCNSKQRRDDLECILFMLEKILIYNPERIKKRWQFFSITFIMQKLLHQNNTWQLRQEGVRLFILWYQILCDETNTELQTVFASLVPGIVPQPDITTTATPTISKQQAISSQQQQLYSVQHQQQLQHDQNPSYQQLPIKLCSVDPLVPMSPDEQLPDDEISLYLDCLLQYMVTQTTKPVWATSSEARKNQEFGFSFTFNMFKKIYLQYLFPKFNIHLSSPNRSIHSNISLNQYVDDVSDLCPYKLQNSEDAYLATSPSSTDSPKRELLQINLKKSNFLTASSPISPSSIEQDRSISLSNYQAIVIKWLTRILRQDMIPGQDELIRSGGSIERREGSREATSGQDDSEYAYGQDGNSTTVFQGIETTSSEMEIARRVIGTWPENITVVHELFRRAFLNYHQPASMKRVVNVYKEWICNGGPNQASTTHGRCSRSAYTSFSDLLQIFVANSSNAFVTKMHNPNMLDEQVEMCKRIMNIYRYMVMKIYMNTTTWEQLLNAMLSITQHLFPEQPPEKKENTIGGRIAPAFFQTFIVSWIRANLYVHISNHMWIEFHTVMKSLVNWKELVEEWSTTMGSLTRVLVKHVYGISLTDLPLDKPQGRRRSRAVKSFSTAENLPKSPEQNSPCDSSVPMNRSLVNRSDAARVSRSGSVQLQSIGFRNFGKSLIRSNSDGIIFSNASIYPSSRKLDRSVNEMNMRRIKSEYLLLISSSNSEARRRADSPTHNDVLDGTSLKDPNMIIEHDQTLESHHSSKSSTDTPRLSKKSTDLKSTLDKCVLLGGNIRGWTNENSVIMWRRMLGLFGNINQIEDPENHLIAIKCLESILNDFTRTRENLAVSLDNQSTPEQPNFVPPYIHAVAWLLEATHLPPRYQESRLKAFELLNSMSIRRHDMELPQQYYPAYYECIQRGLASSDLAVHTTIIRNATKLLSLELPGCTFLAQGLFERSRSILLTNPKEMNVTLNVRDQAMQILNSILALQRPIRKLMVLKLEQSNSMNLVTIGDIRSKVFDTLMACNTQSIGLDCQTKSKSLCSMAIHVYQELGDKSEVPEIEKLFDILLTELQDFNSGYLFRMICDILRLFSDHAQSIAVSRPQLVSNVIQITCQQIVRLSTDKNNKEAIHFLLFCLEDWCLNVGKNFMIKPVGQLSSEDDETLSTNLNASLITIVLRSLENVVHDEQYMDDLSHKDTRGSISTSKTSDAQSRQSQVKSLNSDNGTRERTLTNDAAYHKERITMHSTNINNNNNNPNLNAIKLACKVTRHKLITYLGHFPLRHVGAASMSCCVSESDYLANESELADLKNTAGVVLLVVNNSTIISFIGAPKNSEGIHQPIHMIVRDICGKYSWDISCIELDTHKSINEPDKSSIIIDPDLFQEPSRSSMKYDSDFNEDGNSTNSFSSKSSSNRDSIGDLLNQLTLSITSAASSNPPTSLSHQSMEKETNSAYGISESKFKMAQAEETMIALLTNQRFQELNYCEKSDDVDKVVLKFGDSKSPRNLEGSHDNNDLPKNLISLEQCRQFVQQLGYLSWEKRCKVDSLTKSPRLLRELKNLDFQSGRETHKIAVIYVANGQEDKNSILLNCNGSRAFEEFVAGLGWEVNLSSHLGFMGGLQSNKSTGETSSYYCNGTTEVMFHVSTAIPLSDPPDDESLNRKLRHLGNDEIHIVWSEHTRDYRRGIIPTEFGDVIIAIYPMLTFQGYFRVQVSSKHDVPPFGPLFDNCIVHQTSLAPLVRATAINASRAKRLKLAYYQSHFEERSRLIESIVQNHKEKLSFEDFTVQFYSIGEIKTGPTAGPNVVKNSSLSARPTDPSVYC